MKRKTLIGKVDFSALTSSAVSGLLAVATVGLVALGVGMIFVPAGVITAGLGCAILQWQFFGQSEDGVQRRQ